MEKMKYVRRLKTKVNAYTSTTSKINLFSHLAITQPAVSSSI